MWGRAPNKHSMRNRKIISRNTYKCGFELCALEVLLKKKKSHDQGHTCTHIWNVLRHYIKGTGTYCRVLNFFINLPHSGTLWSSIKWDIFTATPNPLPSPGDTGQSLQTCFIVTIEGGALGTWWEEARGCYEASCDVRYRLQDKTSMPEWENPVLYLKYKTLL